VFLWCGNTRGEAGKAVGLGAVWLGAGRKASHEEGGRLPVWLRRIAHDDSLVVANYALNWTTNSGPSP